MAAAAIGAIGMTHGHDGQSQEQGPEAILVSHDGWFYVEVGRRRHGVEAFFAAE